MKLLAHFLWISLIICCGAFAFERLSCEWLLGLLGDGKTFSDVRQYLDEQLLRDTAEPLSAEDYDTKGALAPLLLTKFPEQAFQHLTEFVFDESMPLRARLLALKKAINYGAEENILPTLKQKVIDLEKELVENYFDLQAQRVDGVLPPEFQHKTSLSKEDLPTRYRGLVQSMASDMELFAKGALRALSELSPKDYRELVRRLAGFYLENDAVDPAVLRKVLSENDWIVKHLALKLSPRAAAETLRIFHGDKDSLDLVLSFAKYHWRREGDGKGVTERDAVVAALDAHTNEHLLRALSQKGSDFVYLFSQAEDIGKLRSLHSHGGGKLTVLANRIVKEIQEAGKRPLARTELYRLLTSVQEIRWRHEQPGSKDLSKDKELVHSIQLLLGKLNSDAQNPTYNMLSLRVARPEADLNTYRVLNDLLYLLNMDPELGKSVIQESSTLRLIHHMAKDHENIYGSMNQSLANRLLASH